MLLLLIFLVGNKILYFLTENTSSMSQRWGNCSLSLMGTLYTRADTSAAAFDLQLFESKMSNARGEDGQGLEVMESLC